MYTLFSKLKDSGDASHINIIERGEQCGLWTNYPQEEISHRSRHYPNFFFNNTVNRLANETKEIRRN